MASLKRPFESPDRNRPRKRSFGGHKPNNFSISSGSIVSKIEDPMPSESRFEVQEDGSAPQFDQEEELDPQFDDFLSQIQVPTVNSHKERNSDKEFAVRELEEMGRVDMLEKKLADSNNKANAFRKEHEELLRKKEEEIMRLKAENERLEESRSSIEAFRENEIKRLKQRVHDQGMANKNPKNKIDENPSFFQMAEFFGECLDSRFVDYNPDINPVFPEQIGRAHV